MSVLPIVTYNDPVLRAETIPIDQNDEALQKLIADMFQTMYNSNGIGLAAPQIGKSIQLFVVDADTITEDLEDQDNYGQLVFINPEIISQTGEKIKMEEGCLSIPDVRDDVTRPEKIKIKYLDRDFNEQVMEFSGWMSRVIQHEYDHLKGVLFIDYLSAFRKRIHKSALKKIEKGKFETEYPLAAKINSEY